MWVRQKHYKIFREREESYRKKEDEIRMEMKRKKKNYKRIKFQSNWAIVIRFRDFGF